MRVVMETRANGTKPLDQIKSSTAAMKKMLEKFDKKQKMMGISLAVLVIGVAIVLALILNQNRYAVLFSKVEAEEANAIIKRLQDEGISYQDDGMGNILVEKELVDTVRADMVFDGYPKSGFTYDTYIANASGMTTTTEKEVYKLYELQDRIGATIRLFDGVRDAKVTIALAKDNLYVIGGETEKNSASVTVSMKPGNELDQQQAQAIQHLVAGSVQGMEESDVGVFDSNGNMVSTLQEEDGHLDYDQISDLLENQITAKILNILTPFYGRDNIRVSTKGIVDIKNVLQESVTYTTPEKIDEKDKDGIISSEQLESYVGNGNTTGGVTGTEENADTPSYSSKEDGNNNVKDESSYKEYLVNQLTEQGEVNHTILSDISISVALNGTADEEGQIPLPDIRELIRNAAGIEPEEAEGCITIIRHPFYEEEQLAIPAVAGDFLTTVQGLPTIVWIVLGGALFLLILLIIVATMVAKKRKKKRNKEKSNDKYKKEIEKIKRNELVLSEDEGIADILELGEGKHKELQNKMRDLVDEDPEIIAQLLHDYLSGGEL